MRLLPALIAIAMAGAPFASGALAQTTASSPAPVDYAQDSAWLCRPGRDDACKVDLDAVAVDAAGGRTPLPFVPAKAPAIDCFYVYPTVSHDEGRFSELEAKAAEKAVARDQAARFAARCRVFAPLYRQLTLPELSRMMGAHAPLDWDAPYADVRDAWRRYLAHDNGGRGVVLIGHSQGSILLARLIADEIEGKPAQKLMVSALLAGHPAILVPRGRDVGATFKSTPICRAVGQTGCVAVWSTYAEADDNPHRVFGDDPANAPDFAAACVNPAALAGGRGLLHGYLHKPAAAPESDPPWVETVGQTSGACVSDAQGTVLRVKVEPGRYAQLLNLYLGANASRGSGWGLHPLDLALTQGDLLAVVDAQAKAWTARSR